MIAIVTGASSGIGYQVCLQLLEKGYTVYGISRRGTVPEADTAKDPSARCIGIAADVTDTEAITRAVADVAAKEGQIDLLVANAGKGISGPIEFTEADAAQKIMNVNFFGAFYTAKAVLPYMRERRQGTIVFTSSVAAPIAIPYQAFYSATKSAINSLALALRNEVRDFNIRVSAVMPGDSGTGFTDAREKDASGNAAYPRCEAAVAAMERDERGGIPPAKVAAVIVRAATKKNPAPLYVAGFKYRLLLALYNLLPARTAVWLVGKFY